jgi:hypothetical protein
MSEIPTLTAEQIAVAIPPGPARERALKRVHEYEVSQRARVFRDAVLRGDYHKAGELFLAEVGHLERKTFIFEIDGDDCITLAKNSTRKVVDAILQVHNNPAVVRRAMIPDEQIAPYVVVTSKANIQTYRRELEPDELEKLEAAGASDLLLAPERETQGYEDGRRTKREPHRFAGIGFAQGASYAMKRARWEAIVHADPMVGDMLASGQLVVEHLTTDEARVFMPVAGGQ